MNAWLVFLDESGLLMAPLVRRSWAPRGQPMVFYQRTRHHQRVSIIAALCVAPQRDEVRLCFRLHPDTSINGQLVLEFLRALGRQLNGPVVLVWDRLKAHRAKVVKAHLHSNTSLHTYFLPPYAPELNPVENVWSYLKMNPMANFAPGDLETLTQTTRRSARSTQRKPHLLRSFLKHTPLSLRLK